MRKTRCGGKHLKQQADSADFPQSAAKTRWKASATGRQRERVDVELHQLELRHAELRIRDADRQKRLSASVAEVGQLVPVVVVAEGDRFVLIDGYLRVAELARLKRDTATATAWPLGEVEALIHRHHLGASGRSALEEAWLLAHVARERGLAGDELARHFCRSKSWGSRRLALVGELSAEIQVGCARVWCRRRRR